MLRPTSSSLFLVVLTTIALLTFPIYAQAQSPQISSVSPTSSAANASVTITGSGFGSTQGKSMVTFGGVSAGITSWSATSIVAVARLLPLFPLALVILSS